MATLAFSWLLFLLLKTRKSSESKVQWKLDPTHDALQCAIPIVTPLAGIEKKQIFSVGFGVSYESFPKNESFSVNWWGLEGGSRSSCFLSCLFTVKFTAWQTHKAENGDLFLQDRRHHYIFSCSSAIFLKFISRNPSSAIECW